MAGINRDDPLSVPEFNDQNSKQYTTGWSSASQRPDAPRPTGGPTMHGGNAYRDSQGFTQYRSPHSDADAAARNRMQESPLAQAAQRNANVDPQRDNLLNNNDMSRMLGSMRRPPTEGERDREMRNATVGSGLTDFQKAALQSSMRRSYAAQDQAYADNISKAYGTYSNHLRGAEDATLNERRGSADLASGLEREAMAGARDARSNDLNYDTNALNRAYQYEALGQQGQQLNRAYAMDVFNLENAARERGGLDPYGGAKYLEFAQNQLRNDPISGGQSHEGVFTPQSTIEAGGAARRAAERAANAGIDGAPLAKEFAMVEALPDGPEKEAALGSLIARVKTGFQEGIGSGAFATRRPGIPGYLKSLFFDGPAPASIAGASAPRQVREGEDMTVYDSDGRPVVVKGAPVEYMRAVAQYPQYFQPPPEYDVLNDLYQR